MISYFETTMPQLSVNWVGNKTMDEGCILSEQPLKVDQEKLNLLIHFFLKPFDKVNNLYNLYHPSDNFSLNSLYTNVKNTFEVPELLNVTGRDIAMLLHDKINHPKVKSGELYVAYFENVQIDGELNDAIGIFKSETKETYLKILHQQYGFGIDSEKDGININSLDKGCLILNTSADFGYKVLVFDNSAKNAPLYWIDDFLGLKIVNNNFHNTEYITNICRNFILEKLDDEFEISKSDKVDLLNKSIKYFIENEAFELEDYANQVLKDPSAVSSFKSYKSIHDEEFDSNVPDSFELSSAAVKKNKKLFKPVIKLDKNFQVHVHGNRDLIEKGYDDDKSMSFYKLYFKEEQ